jgi:hypothetical protein
METETVQHLVCRCEALSGLRYNVLGERIIEPKDVCTATVKKSVSHHQRHRVIWTVLNGAYRVCTISLGLRCFWGISWRIPLEQQQKCSREVHVQSVATQCALSNFVILGTIRSRTHSCTGGRVSPVTENVGSGHSCCVTHILSMAAWVSHLLTWWPHVSSRCTACSTSCVCVCVCVWGECCTPGLYSPRRNL